MDRTFADLNTPGRLSDLLEAGRALPPMDCLRLIERLAGEIRALHEGGRIHRAIRADQVIVNERLQPRLSPAPASCRFGAECSDVETCPPELAGGEAVDLPDDLPSAAAVLQERGLALDPRRIDIHQLGALLFRLLAGRPIGGDVRTAIAELDVDPTVRSILEGMLDPSSAHGFSTCDQLIGALEEALEQTVEIGERVSAPDDTLVASDDATAGRVVHPNEETRAEVAPIGPAPAESAFARLGEFRIVRRIGRGGMGEVFLAHDESLDRPVAIKVLTPELACQESFVKRFRAEASAVAKLVHPNVVQVYSFKQERGHYFFVMQFVDGRTLAHLLARRGPLDTERALDIAEQCLTGLAAAHRRGLVHRDVKPRNILLEHGSSKALLADFGLVKTAGRNTGATAAGTVLGTASYISPEQAQGRPVDPRSDLYAMGVVLYEMLSGELPFKAEVPTAMLYQHVYEPPRPLEEVTPDVPPSLAAAVARLLEKDPAARYQTAEEVIDELGRVRESLHKSAAALEPTRPMEQPTVTTVKPQSAADREAPQPGKARRGRRKLVLTALAACLVLIVSSLVLWSRPGRDADTAESERNVAPDVRLAAVEAAQGAPAPTPNAEGPAPALGESPRVCPVAILPFRSLGSGEEDAGERVSEILFASLVAKPEICLVERADVEKILNEYALNLSGIAAPDQAARVGYLTGAKILVTGSVVEIDHSCTIAVKIIGTETSRVLGVSVGGKRADGLMPLVEELAAKVEAAITGQTDELIAVEVTREDRIEALKRKLGDARRPTVAVRVAERHVGQVAVDPAAQTELVRCLKEAGFEVVDPDSAAAGEADVTIAGEAFSEFAMRHGNLVSVKARVEITATDRASGRVLASDRQVAVEVDLAEQIAGKTALGQAALEIALRALPPVVREWNQLHPGKE